MLKNTTPAITISHIKLKTKISKHLPLRLQDEMGSRTGHHETGQDNIERRKVVHAYRRRGRAQRADRTGNI